MNRSVIAAAACAGALLLVGPLTATLRVVAQSTTFELPAPTGRYPIGTTSWRLIDPSRREIFTGSRDARNVEVLAWYPATSVRADATAPDLREGLPEVHAFATVFGVAEDAFDALQHVRTHASLDAPPAVTTGKLPVLLFAHGYTGIPSAYTALMEDLASHGYAVLSVVHPYEATAATLADGRVVTLFESAGKLRAPLTDVFAEWATEDATMAAVTRASDRAEQLR